MPTDLLHIARWKVAFGAKWQHHADIALYNFHVMRLNRLCQRYNRSKGLNVFPVLRSTFKIFGKVNKVFNGTHGVVMSNDGTEPRRANDAGPPATSRQIQGAPRRWLQ